MRKRSLLFMGMAEVRRQHEEFTKRRQSELELCSRYANSDEDQQTILVEVSEGYVPMVLRILRTHQWLSWYLGDTEEFIDQGLCEECLATAIMGMYYYPNRHNFLVEYILDASLAAIITRIGDDESNTIVDGWDRGFAVAHTGFYYQVSLHEHGDEDPYS